MVYEEALLLLAVLRAAYPTDFPYNMSEEDAEATAIVWCEQFLNVPGFIVELAVKQLISIEEKPPSVATIKKQIGSLYWEAKGILDDNERNVKHGLCSPLPKEEREYYNSIKKATENYKLGKGYSVPSIKQLVSTNENFLIGSGNNDA